MNKSRNRIFIIEGDSLIYRLYGELFPERDRFAVMPQLTAFEKLAAYTLSEDDIVITDISAAPAEAEKHLAQLRERFPLIQVIAVAERADTISSFTEQNTFSVLRRPFRFEMLRKQVENCIRFTTSNVQKSISGGLEEFSYPLAEKVRRNPKGLKAELLNTIIELMQESPESCSVKEVAGMAKVSASTARRYMEYLLKDGRLTVEYSYKRAGHPEKRYTIALM